MFKLFRITTRFGKSAAYLVFLGIQIFFIKTLGDAFDVSISTYILCGVLLGIQKF